VADAMEPGRQDVDQEAADELVGGERQTPARWSAEVAATKTMLTRTQEHFGLTPQTLAADAANGSGQMLGRLMGCGIEPHIPMLDREHQTKGHFTRADFTFDAAAISSSVPAVRSGARRWDHAEARMVRRLLPTSSFTSGGGFHPALVLIVIVVYIRSRTVVIVPWASDRARGRCCGWTQKTRC